MEGNPFVVKNDTNDQNSDLCHMIIMPPNPKFFDDDMKKKREKELDRWLLIRKIQSRRFSSQRNKPCCDLLTTEVCAAMVH